MEQPPVQNEPKPQAMQFIGGDTAEGVVSSTNEKFELYRSDKRAHEVIWFITSAFTRGLQYVIWNDYLQKLEQKDAPPHRIRLTINRMLPKYKARQAKFLKNRFDPQVVAASTDPEDQMNAKATKQALDYILRKEHFERKYREALNWSNICGKAFMWFYWDENKPARIKDPQTGQAVQDIMGDVAIEVSSPFEVLVADQSISYIGKQPEIMRVRQVSLDDIYARYPNLKGQIQPEEATPEIFQYQRQMSTVTTKGTGMGLGNASSNDNAKKGETALVKEHFTAPCGKYPKGRYVVVIGTTLAKYVPELPYEFAYTQNNPYPCVEFPDNDLAGQFWPPTLLEQLIGVQKEYNLLRSKLAEQSRMMAHPKVMVPAQSQFPENAWTSEAGEVIRYLSAPGLPAPQVINFPNIAQDIWNALKLIKEEFDDITNLYPASQGAVGQASSGFQTNLLQEAADSIHAPDIRLHELAMEEACYKIRKLMQLGYDVPRLMSITSKNLLPNVIEFSQENIDESAEIVVWTGSALSNSPAVRTQQVLELWGSGLLSGNGDPERIRQTLKLINVNGIGELQETTARDEEAARLENEAVKNGNPLNRPMPWENHQIHWETHADFLKSPESKLLDPQLYSSLVEHLIFTERYINPNQAITTAMELGRQDLIPELQPPAPPQPPQPPQPGPPQPNGPASPNLPPPPQGNQPPM